MAQAKCTVVGCILHVLKKNAGRPQHPLPLPAKGIEYRLVIPLQHLIRTHTHRSANNWERQKKSIGHGECVCVCALRALRQRSHRRLLRSRDPLPTSLRNLRTFIGDENRRAFVPPMRPVTKITKSEHRDDMPARVCFETTKNDKRERNNNTHPQSKRKILRRETLAS